MMGLAYLVEKHLPGGDMYDPISLVKEFRRTINRELDFSREGRTIDRFAANFADDECVRIPAVFWDYTGRTVLTLEYLAGIKISCLNDLEEAGMDLKVLAHNGADNFLKQVLSMACSMRTLIPEIFMSYLIMLSASSTSAWSVDSMMI